MIRDGDKRARGRCRTCAQLPEGLKRKKGEAWKIKSKGEDWVCESHLR